MEELKENLKAELLKIGIRNESDLQEAIRNLPPLNLSVMGTDCAKENFMVPASFSAAVHNKEIVTAFRNFFDYLVRSDKILPKEVAIGHIKNRIAQVEAKVENRKNKPL